MGLILERFLKCLPNFERTKVRKDLRWIHERLEMGSYTAEVFSAVLPRMRILKLNARSRTSGFAYIHAPPAPYMGTQP